MAGTFTEDLLLIEKELGTSGDESSDESDNDLDLEEDIPPPKSSKMVTSNSWFTGNYPSLAVEDFVALYRMKMIYLHFLSLLVDDVVLETV